MSAIRWGCQTYTWQMNYARNKDRLAHIMGVVATAGFTGIEPEVCMLGRYNHNPAKLRADLDSHGLELGALCLVCDWLGTEETDDENREADRVIAMLKKCFPDTVLALGQMPRHNRTYLRERQHNCMACCNAIGKRSTAAGICAAFHPNSPPGSVFRTEQDYAVLLDGLDKHYVGFAPDAGHITKGGMDPVTIFTQYSSAIRHIHFKDMKADGSWAEMGQGIIDFPGIVGVLKKMRYSGWIMIEDESPLAENDPDAVTRINGEFIRRSTIAHEFTNLTQKIN